MSMKSEKAGFANPSNFRSSRPFCSKGEKWLASALLFKPASGSSTVLA